MVKFLDSLGVPVASALPVSGQSGEIVFYAGAFYGWNGSAWAPLGGVTDGDKGDLTVSGGIWTLDANVVTLSKLAQVGTASLLGRTSAGSGDVEALTSAQATALLSIFTAADKGLVPAPAASSGKFLKDDGTWASVNTVIASDSGWVLTTTSTGLSQDITLPESLPAENVIVTIEGLVQNPDDYTVSGTTLSLTAPDTGLSISVRRMGAPVGGASGLAGMTVLHRTSEQAQSSNVWSPVAWQVADYDNLSAWSGGASVTVPTGVSWMRVSGFFPWENSSSGNRYLQVVRSSGSGTVYVTGDIRSAVNESLMSINSSWVPVVAGSTYEAETNPGSSSTALGGSFGGYPTITYEWAASLDDLLIRSTNATAVTKTLTDTSYDLLSIDEGKYLRFTASAAKAINVRTQATHALRPDSEWNIRNVGSGVLTLAPAAGVTINIPANGSLVVPQGGTVTLKRVANDEFDLLGQTTST